MVKLIVYLTQAFVYITVVSSRRLSKSEEAYLERFGYLSPITDGKERSDGDLREGILLFQTTLDLGRTGTMTEETSAMMVKRRCGLKDIEEPKSYMQLKYSWSEKRWLSTSLTYSFLNYSSDLTENQTRETVESALKLWSDVTPLVFTEVSENGDIEILFQAGEHGDDFPFDGPSGVLAHAFYPGPGLGGDAHFDEDEDFTLNGAPGIDLFYVAVHEFGHSLGLNHSTDATAVMYPYYPVYSPNLQLSQDDIDGIQYVYGSNPDAVADSTTPTVPDSTTIISTDSNENEKECLCRRKKIIIDYPVNGDINYMMKYGYMEPMTHGSQHTDEEMEEGIMKFQEFNGMEQSGNMNTATMEKMEEPRCGVKDILNTPGSVRARRYAFSGSRWSSTTITYRYLNYSPDLTQAETRSAIEQAFKVWSDVTPLRFQEVTSGDAIILILFQAGEHGDGNDFDGPSGTLAHAYFPTEMAIGGDAHFDESETFSVNGNLGIDLFQVAAHEFGHSMGLAHSSDPNALMAPYYAGYVRNFRLPLDDINGIQALYGSNQDGGNPVPTNPPVGRMTETPPRMPMVTPFPTNPARPESCNNNIDAISFLRRELYIFQGDQFLRLAMRGSVMEGYPSETSAFFNDLEDNIDASYERSTDGAFMFFKGNMYWEYNGNNMVRGFPSLISNLGDLPNNLDATLRWGNTRYTYFFKGDQYWRYNEVNKRVDDDYPRDIATGWPGVPDNLDAAFRWLDGNTYFVRNGQYWYFNENLQRVDENVYPRDFGEDWLSCEGLAPNKALLKHYSFHIIVLAFVLATLV
ncbi:matrix metalloproteinase-17-like [Antedon mediterranea]|uniref:matrix metalloproteinase-17-like n=1 Tax=Antedon mediterranea TaxID=105859 RepID=UPI003AF4E6B3